MNIHEAATGGRPFRNPGMIGAWMIVDGQMVHRDNIADFQHMDWIKANCLRSGCADILYWMTVSDLIRNDWELV